jgi:hypothetical protein
LPNANFHLLPFVVAFHYIIQETTFLVNADRVERKLPSLLVDNSTTKKKNWNSFMRYRYRFAQFKKRQPEKFNSITNRILEDLMDLEKAVSEAENKPQ